MFIDIDYNKRKQDILLHLSKPNKTITDVITERFNTKLSVKLGNINQLDFSIPYNVEDATGNMVLNPHINTIKEKMLIRVTLGTYIEWYIVDTIEEDADTTDTFNVTAFSLGYELKGKRIDNYTEDSINANDLLTNLLNSTVWKIGTIDPIFNEMYRSFDSGADSNVLDCITNAGTTYGALIVWNTDTRTIDFKDATKSSEWRGMTIDYGKFIQSIKRTRTTDELTTRLWVYGANDLGIEAVNPTGMGYIENFGYFMYPFQRDANKNVTSHSDYMSDALCNALLDHEDAVTANGDSIKSIQSQLSSDQSQMVTEQAKMTDLQNEMNTILGELDIAKATNDQTTIDERVSDRDAKQTEIDQQQIVINNLQAKIDGENNDLNTLLAQISTSSFSQDLLDELNLFIIEGVWRGDSYVDVQELYDDALTQFDEIRQPKVVIDVTIDNLLNIVEEQYYWDKITLGDQIKVKYPQMSIEYMATMIQFDYDFDNSGIAITIANTTDLLSDTDKLVQLLYSNSNATTVIQSNANKWNKIAYVQDQVDTMISSAWDATKNEIIAGVNNSVTVGNRGIIVKNPDTPDDIVIIQAGVIALSKDNGETWKTAVKPDGIVAETLIGQVIAGQNLLITNSSGSFTMDENGAYFDVGSFTVRSSGDSSTNLVDNWQNASSFVTDYTSDSMITPYEKTQINRQWNDIATEYTSISATIDGYYDSATKATLQWVTDFDNAYTALYNYLFVDKQTDNFALLDSSNASVTTRIDATIYNTKFSDYTSTKNEANKQLSLKAIDVANTAQQNITEVQNDIVYKCELHSSNGTEFKNGDITTTMYVVVYKGKDDITSTLPNSAFIWKKTNKDGTDDTTWNNNHVGVGSTIQVTKDDVFQKATFWCDIDIE